MIYLSAAVVLVGLLCLLDLVLSLGVIHRLRQHTDHLNRLLETAASSADYGVPVGEVVGDFTATSTAGAPVSRERLADRTVVGFFSPGCGPCATQLPLFVEYARSLPDGARQALAVVDASSADELGYVDRLSEVAQVVTEASRGTLQAAFKVAGFPSLFLVDSGGVVRASGFTVDDLDRAAVPEPVAA